MKMCPAEYRQYVFLDRDDYAMGISPPTSKALMHHAMVCVLSLVFETAQRSLHQISDNEYLNHTNAIANNFIKYANTLLKDDTHAAAGMYEIITGLMFSESYHATDAFFGEKSPFNTLVNLALKETKDSRCFDCDHHDGTCSTCPIKCKHKAVKCKTMNETLIKCCKDCKKVDKCKTVCKAPCYIRD